MSQIIMHIEKARKMEIDERAVIDSMRPDSQELWSSLPTDDEIEVHYTPSAF